MTRFLKREIRDMRGYLSSAYIEHHPIDTSWSGERAKAYEAHISQLLRDPRNRQLAVIALLDRDINQECERRESNLSTARHWRDHFGSVEIFDRFNAFAAVNEGKLRKLKTLREKVVAVDPAHLPQEVMEHDYREYPL